MGERLPLSHAERERASGSALIVALSFLAVLMILMSAFVSNVIATTGAQSRLEAQTRSFYIADAGVNYALWKLEQDGTYKGEVDVEFGEGYFDVQIVDLPGDSTSRTIVSSSRLDGYPEGHAERQIRAIARLESREGKHKFAVLSWDLTR
jgi:Tfp pilus assembly protein PilX